MREERRQIPEHQDLPHVQDQRRTPAGTALAILNVGRITALGLDLKTDRTKAADDETPVLGPTSPATPPTTTDDSAPDRRRERDPNHEREPCRGRTTLHQHSTGQD